MVNRIAIKSRRTLVSNRKQKIKSDGSRSWIALGTTQIAAREAVRSKSRYAVVTFLHPEHLCSETNFKDRRFHSGAHLQNLARLFRASLFDPSDRGSKIKEATFGGPAGIFGTFGSTPKFCESIPNFFTTWKK